MKAPFQQGCFLLSYQSRFLISWRVSEGFAWWMIIFSHRIWRTRIENINHRCITGCLTREHFSVSSSWAAAQFFPVLFLFTYAARLIDANNKQFGIAVWKLGCVCKTAWAKMTLDKAARSGLEANACSFPSCFFSHMHLPPSLSALLCPASF